MKEVVYLHLASFQNDTFSYLLLRLLCLLHQENETMETASEEEEQGGNDDKEDEENPQRSDLPVATTTQPGLSEKTTEDAEIQKPSEEGAQQQLQVEKGACPWLFMLSRDGQ